MLSNIKAAKLLGWTSIAVGVTELGATRWLENEMGVEGRQAFIRGFGLREIAAGVMILSQPGLNQSLAASLWGRVAGDAMDLAALGIAHQSSRNRNGLAIIISIVLAITGMDIVVASLIQQDLRKAAQVAAAARKRVSPTNAIPLEKAGNAVIKDVIAMS